MIFGMCKGREAEIEITPTMIEAGARAILADPLMDCGLIWAETLAEEVLICAFGARAQTVESVPPIPLPLPDAS